MSQERIGLAIFVKTPGLSPIKTRLAAGIGEGAAAEFYALALGAVAEVVAAAAAEHPTLVPVWAVAEPAGLGWPGWRSFPSRWQGDGDLGARMATVYEALRAESGAAILIGADVPLLRAGDLAQATDALWRDVTPFVMGRALDGGFYLFGGRDPLPPAEWAAVTYGRADTADRLLDRLRPGGGVAFLEPLPDVDTAADLDAVLMHPRAGGELLPAQRRLLAWVRQLQRATP